MRRQEGFTLVELMIVVAILGVLGMIAVPLYNHYVAGAKISEARANLETIRLLEEQYYADQKTYLAGATVAALADPATGLPGFEPDKDPTNLADPFHKLYYTYKVEAGVNAGGLPWFTATATSKRDPAQILTINEKNEKTGPW